MVAPMWLVGTAIAACLTGADAFSVSISSSPRVPSPVVPWPAAAGAAIAFLPRFLLAGSSSKRAPLACIVCMGLQRCSAMRGEGVSRKRVISDGLGVRRGMRAAAVTPDQHLALFHASSQSCTIHSTEMLMNVCLSSLTPGSAAHGACVRKQAPGMAALGSAKTGALRRSAVSGAIVYNI